MGEQNLSKTMKKYYDDWSMKHPTDRDFIHIAQKISGMDFEVVPELLDQHYKTIDYGIKSVKIRR